MYASQRSLKHKRSSPNSSAMADFEMQVSKFITQVSVEGSQQGIFHSIPGYSQN